MSEQTYGHAELAAFTRDLREYASKQTRWAFGWFAFAAIALFFSIGSMIEASKGANDGIAYLWWGPVVFGVFYGIRNLVRSSKAHKAIAAGVAPSLPGRDPRTRSTRDIQKLTAPPRASQREGALDSVLGAVGFSVTPKATVAAQDSHRESASEIEAMCNCGLIRSAGAGSQLRGDGVKICNWCSKPLGFTIKATTAAAVPASAVPEDRATRPATLPGATEETETYLSAPRSSDLATPQAKVDEEPNLAQHMSRLAQLRDRGDLTEGEFRLLATRLLDGHEAG